MDGWTPDAVAANPVGRFGGSNHPHSDFNRQIRIHALLTLVIVSLLTAAAGLPTGSVSTTYWSKASAARSAAWRPGRFWGAMLRAFGQKHPAARSLADWSDVRRKRAPFALSVASLTTRLPDFLRCGLIVMLPICSPPHGAQKQDVLPLRLPPSAHFPSCTSSCRPIRARCASRCSANIGKILILGLPTALHAWYFSGYMLGSVGARHPCSRSRAQQRHARPTTCRKRPAKAGNGRRHHAPVVLLVLNAGVSALISEKLVSADETWVPDGKNNPVRQIMLISVLVALFVLGRKRGESGNALEKTVDGTRPRLFRDSWLQAGGMFSGISRFGIGKRSPTAWLGIPVARAVSLSP